MVVSNRANWLPELTLETAHRWLRERSDPNGREAMEKRGAALAKGQGARYVGIVLELAKESAVNDRVTSKEFAFIAGAFAAIDLLEMAIRAEKGIA